ncbi:unnamed protein product [Leptosia nina]|uniref:Protein I'm not dead yet n=1 Tax=Leptosia nina TaxID=320188 RepID=A0AAV1IX73_9NEOP
MSTTGAAENGIADEGRGTTYYFSKGRTSATLWQRINLFISIYWKALIVVITPLILLPIPIINAGSESAKAFKCMYVVLIMATYWVLELLPLPVTSMLPIVMFPTLGILDSDKTCAAYMKETNMMFMGGLMIAAGVQHSKLPKRVALWTVQVVGCSHRRLNLGLTFVTMFISMWVSNAAATTMMVPIVEAILEVFEQQGLGDVYINKKKSAENGKQIQKPTTEEESPIPSDITTCYYLSIAYASTLGGCGTLVGTATNSAFKGIFDSEFPEISGAVDFFWFMAYSTPPMLLMQMLVWIALQVTFMGLFRPNSEAAKKVNAASSGSENTMKVIREQYKNLGPVTFHEKASGALFILAVFLYIFRKPGFMLGWADVITTMKVKDGVVSMFIVILMFILPMSVDCLKFFSASSSYEELSQYRPSPSIVTWNILKEKIPWGLLFLLGGGFALAEGSKATGLSSMIGTSLIGLRGLHPSIVLLVVVLVTQFITEFTSNVAIANLILPVLANMARTLDMDPRYLMVPATLACSMAFHMPVGTPPNAIVAGVAHIPTSKMAIGGIGPKIITTLIIWGAYPTWGSLIFKPGDIAALSAPVTTAGTLSPQTP